MNERDLPPAPDALALKARVGYASDMDITRARAAVDAAATGQGIVLVLSGAGLSADSGIPTFRGTDGFWTVGSKNYRPMDLAMLSAFDRMPDDVWAWSLYRRSLCLAAQPNPAHVALVQLESLLQDRYRHVTQNVDGLHFRAGSTLDRTYCIHGDINRMRCSVPCGRALFDIPPSIDSAWTKGRNLADGERRLLTCPACGQRTRPHVLWFDEYYDEEWFRFDSSISVAASAEVLIVVGTSGSTTLPDRIFGTAKAHFAHILVIDQQPSFFADAVADYPRGHSLLGPAAEVLPQIVAAVRQRVV